MSDSDKTNELDNYGVWVKKPPRTVSSETENTEDLSDLTADLPDFSETEVIDNSSFDSGETALSTDELANIADMGTFEESSPSSEATEEISLDEFIEGGVFEGDDTAPVAPENTESSATSEETVSTDDFMESSDISVTDSSAADSSASTLDDGPLDIDLSFDDTDSTAASVSTSSAAEVPGSESVDLSDFGVDFTSDDSSSASTSNDGTESVDLSDFGFDINAPESTGEEAPAQEEAASSEHTVNEDGTENIDLSDFGFDINAEESTGESEVAESEPEEESESTPPLTAEEPAFTATEDDVGDISIETDNSEPAEEKSAETSQDFSAPDDDDFDLDSIMDSIEDENGQTTSLNDEPSVNENPVEEVSDVSVVDMEEPVFEETAVDIQEAQIADEVNFADTEIDSSVPADFTAEEPTIHEEASADIDESSVSEDNSFVETVEESPVFTEETQEASPSTETPSIGESFAEVAESSEVFELTPANEEAATEVVEEKTEVKQDSEINSAATNILNQIASELSSLRSEISNLKTEFEELKNRPVDSAVEAPSSEEEIVIPEASDEQETSGGFFDAEDGDETIALSLDEMDNIFNTVEMIEEEAPEVTDDSIESDDTQSVQEPQSLDFSNANIEEPVLDDIDTNIADDELPEEISVPKTEDDILVESSEDNLIEETEEDSPTLELSEEPAIDEIVSEPEEAVEDINFTVEEEPGSSAEAEPMDEPFVFDSESSEAESPLSEEQITEESDQTVEEEESVEESPEVAIEDESSEGEESNDNVSISENELDQLLTSEAAMNEQEEEEEEAPVQSSIPDNLQKEIKSVLSYMDQLLENLPEEKIAEFAQSEQFETYKKLFKELGLN